MTTHETYAGIQYEIRKRTQSKKMSLKVSHDGRVWVSVPIRVSLKDARSFVEKNIAFVQATLDKVAAERTRKASASASGVPLELPLDGQWLKIDIKAGERFAMEIANSTEDNMQETPSFLIITIPREKSADQETARESAVEYWRFSMINRANDILPKRTLELAASFGEPLRRIAVKDQQSLWGSCVKARRSLNLNWRCILFPPSVRDYLIIHELAHLREANHSPAYWKQVEAWCPDYEESERWLKANGRRIMAVTAVIRAESPR